MPPKAIACDPWAILFLGGAILAVVGAYHAQHKLFFRVADGLRLSSKQKGAVIAALFPFLGAVVVIAALAYFVLESPDSLRDFLSCTGG